MKNVTFIRFILFLLTFQLYIIFKPDIISAQIFTKVDAPALKKKTNGYGAGIFDYNKDGKLDLYVNNYGSPSLLFVNNGNDSFSEIKIDNLTPSIGSNSGITLGDYDNDGNNDLFLLSMNGVGSLINNFSDSTYKTINNHPMTGLTGFLIHCTWADYDNDGLLDMFIPACGNSDFKKAGGIKNYLFHNEGEGKFNRIINSEPEKIAGNNVSANFCDFDNDGDMDLFMTDCQVNNHLFENVNGTFTEIETGTFINSNSSIACSWGDYDNDGYMDLFVANGLPTEGGDYDSYLYHNNGNKTFTKITTGEIPEFRGNAWNGLWADFDNDGDLDLYVGTYSQPDVLFINNGDGTFTRDNSEFDMTSKGTSGACFGDYNNDGYLDLFTANAYGTGSLLYKNNGNGKNWIFISCEGIYSNRSAIGAKVKIKATISGKSYWQVREINSNTGFRSVSDIRAHFGLGDATVIDSLIVEWPSKQKTVLTAVQINQNLKIREETPLNFLRPQFKIDINSGYSPLKVQFTDNSIYDEKSPITSWSWDFNGDGKEDSDEKNPSYIFDYYEGGSVKVTLTISNGVNTETLTKTDLINVFPMYQQNIALLQKAEASSISTKFPASASNAVDGKSTTYWQSADSSLQWFKIELDSAYTVGKIVIKWGSNYAKQYTIQCSNDGNNWSNLTNNDLGNGGMDTVEVNTANVKYIKTLMSKCSSSSGFRINEFEIYRHRIISDVKDITCQPSEFILNQNYPNPFNPETVISYQLPVQSYIELKVYDVLGSEITTLVNREQNAGNYQVKFNGSSLSSGIYFYRIKAGNFVKANKMILMR